MQSENSCKFIEENESLQREEYFQNDTSAFEDFLQHNGVFVNGLNGKTSHPDSYLTIILEDQLNKCLDFFEKTFSPTKEEWKFLTDLWLSNPNMQPPLKMVALKICHYNNIEPATVDKSQWI